MKLIIREFMFMETYWSMKRGICGRIVRLDPQIVIAALMKTQPVDWYVKEGVPVTDDACAAKMAQQTLIMMSIVKTGTDYLGELEYVHARMSNMDVIHLSAFGSGIMAIVLNRPYDENVLTSKMRDLLH